MSKIDYKLLYALFMVMQEQSFERAARMLSISQSAVSQRIKQLEEFVGHPVIVRGTPIVPTAIGEQLLSHFRQVQQLENILLPELLTTGTNQNVRLSIAVNTDSVSTWFFSAMMPLLQRYPVELNLLIDNESCTLDKLKSGEVFAAVSLQSHAMPGYQAYELGKMEYILVACEAFKSQYFANGVNADTLKYAPGVSFDCKDDLHIRFIDRHFGLPAGSYPKHTVRYAQAVLDLTRQGVAYALLPRIQLSEFLQNGELINLLPSKSYAQTLYWHCWSMLRGVYKEVSSEMVEYSRRLLD